MRLRVLTFNVQNAAGELDRPGGRDVLARLLDGTGLHGTHQADVLASDPESAGSAERFGGTAVATRWPHVVLEGGGTAAALGTAGAVVRAGGVVPVPSVGSLVLIAPTSSWDLDAEAAREEQAVRLAELDTRYRQQLPTILAGDLNAVPEAASIRFLSGLQSLGGRSAYYHDAWAAAGDGGPGHTWTVDNPRAAAEIEAIAGQPNHRRRIDYVFVGTATAHPHARAASCQRAWSSPSPSTASGSATTTACWWNSRSSGPAERRNPFAPATTG